MAYTDYNWVTDRLAIGGFVHESEEDLPFDAILSMETHAPAVLRDFVRSGRVDYQWRSIIDGICDEEHDEIIRRFDDVTEIVRLKRENLERERTLEQATLRSERYSNFLKNAPDAIASMSRRKATSSPSHSEIAMPAAPARAVRPMRCT